MALTRQHFEAIARAIKADLDASHGGVFAAEQFIKCEYAATIFANMAQDVNGRFDRERFFKACGLR